MRLLHRSFERRQINLPQRPLADDRIRIMPQVLRVVAGEMLDRRAHTLLLHAGDVPHHNRRREEGVFAEVFKVAAIARRAINIHARPQHVMHATRACVAANPCTHTLRKIAVPRCRQPNACRIRRRRKSSIRPSSVRPIRHLKRWQMQRRHSANCKPRSADVVQLLVQRHAVYQRVNLLLVRSRQRMRSLREGRSSHQQG